MELEPGTVEPTRPSPPGMEQGSIVELGSIVTREQSLRQTRMSEFLDLTATKQSSCGSPSQAGDVAVVEEKFNEGRFEGHTEDTVGQVPPVPPDVGREGQDVGAITRVSSGINSPRGG